MDARQVGYAMWAALSGVLIPIAATLNGALGRSIGSPIVACVIMLTVALLFGLALAIVLQPPVPGWSTLAAVPVSRYVAGFGVAFYVLTVTVLAPRFGLANTIMFVLAAQLASAAAIDRFGLFGNVARPLDGLRVAGLLIMAVGVALCQWRR